MSGKDCTQISEFRQSHKAQQGRAFEMIGKKLLFQNVRASERTGSNCFRLPLGRLIPSSDRKYKIEFDPMPAEYMTNWFLEVYNRSLNWNGR